MESLHRPHPCASDDAVADAADADRERQRQVAHYPLSWEEVVRCWVDKPTLVAAFEIYVGKRMN